MLENRVFGQAVGGAIKKITGFQIPFAGSVCNLEYEEAIEYLQKRSKKPNGIVEVHNRLNPPSPCG